jgi:DNA-directed RNA polymerase alpha subunit
MKNYTNHNTRDTGHHDNNESTYSFTQATLALDIRVLRLGVKTATLRNQGIYNIGDLISNSDKSLLSIPGLGRTTVIRIRSALLTLTESESPDGNIDWKIYLETMGLESEATSTSVSVHNFSPATMALDIRTLHLGAKTTTLRQQGIFNVGDLVSISDDALRTIPGLGRTTISKASKALLALAEAENPDGEIDWKIYLEMMGLESEVTSASVSVHNFSPATMALDIRTLHLGAKTTTLRQQGIFNVGDLVSISDDALRTIPGLGRTTISKVRKVLLALAEAENPDGEIDWHIFCSSMGLMLLPAEPLDGTIADSIIRLPSVIQDILRSESNPAIHSIITNRIIKRPSERMTLEEIGTMQVKSLTRERIRQLEVKFLTRLAAGLIENEYAEVPFHFRPEFTEPWQQAALHFSKLESDISLENLISGLEQCWEFSRERFMPLLPLLVAILTGDLPTADDYDYILMIDWKKLSEGANPLIRLPLRHLQLGKLPKTLESSGIQTIGQMIKAMESGDALTRNQKKLAIAQIQAASNAVDNNCNVNWRHYASHAKVPFVPEFSTEDPKDFLTSIIPVCVKIIQRRNLSAIAEAVFTQRASVSADNRPTMDELAHILGKNGPTVKRVETDVLFFLNEVLINQNLSAARTHISLTFLEKWSEVDRWFQEVDGDTELFRSRISAGWQLDEEFISKFLPVLVAILSGYPLGRSGRYSRVARKFPAAITTKPSVSLTTSDFSDLGLPQRIILRGFRQVH